MDAKDYIAVIRFIRFGGFEEKLRFLSKNSENPGDSYKFCPFAKVVYYKVQADGGRITMSWVGRKSFGFLIHAFFYKKHKYKKHWSIMPETLRNI